MMKLTEIPGNGKTFERDFARIGIHSVEQMERKSAEDLFMELQMVNSAEDHKTGKNYLYVIRMCIYFAEGGRDPLKLKWSAWKD
jgi:Pathogenicity locus